MCPGLKLLFLVRTESILQWSKNWNDHISVETVCISHLLLPQQWMALLQKGSKEKDLDRLSLWLTTDLTNVNSCKRLHILLQWFIHYQMLVIYILVQIIGLHMSFCVQAHFLSMYILNCIHPSTIHTAGSWWSALFWAELYQTTALSISNTLKS